ncbi:hypothetical protein K458DRAFT_428928 [Lentithecium fluviatile CBS 122367]|uniref:Uncharacterized protein n=1 Tax=Lentithecium fluviatile CBS 122367 TaxID=1168545 RepID=A0A6G1JDE2_9PLEO|nr:hypothetical protein K458DRAFT_428928 [Lentithecium fluviatile CBS 122367]
MPRGTPSEAEVADTLSHLKLSTKTPQNRASKPKSAPIADSWDEEALSGSSTETDEPAQPSQKAGAQNGSTLKGRERDSLSPISISRVSTADPPNPPPPTPASPTLFEFPDNVPYAPAVGAVGSGPTAGVRGSGAGTEKRPEKTTAVAGRLIAGALGVRAPKRTEEEREYDRVVREKERRRRDEERAREAREREEAEERKRRVWED